jgi:hypothetical protein
LLYEDDGEDNNTPIYGLRLRDHNGNVVMEHGSDGKVWICNELKVGLDSSSVSIGYLKEGRTTKNQTVNSKG